MTQASGETESKADNAESGGSSNLAYRAVMLSIILLGGIAFVVGVAGTFVVLTGGTDQDQTAAVLGEYACETFEEDPQVVHKTDYEIERRVLSPTLVSAFNTTEGTQAVNLSVKTEGPLLAASANTPAGRPITIETRKDRAYINRTSTAPFRLFIDTVSEDGTVTRMQLDICPPVS